MLIDDWRFPQSSINNQHSSIIGGGRQKETLGLQREELQIVALVARYHRRSAPRQSHVEYMTLPRETRMVVSKLAAILRVADAMDRGHDQQVRGFHFERHGDELAIHVPRAADLALERRALAQKADLFQDIYGMSIRLEEAPLPMPDRREESSVG